MRLTLYETKRACVMLMIHDAVVQSFNAKSVGIGLLGKCGELIRMVSGCTNRCIRRSFLRVCVDTVPHRIGSGVRQTHRFFT